MNCQWTNSKTIETATVNGWQLTLKTWMGSYRVVKVWVPVGHLVCPFAIASLFPDWCVFVLLLHPTGNTAWSCSGCSSFRHHLPYHSRLLNFLQCTHTYTQKLNRKTIRKMIGHNWDTKVGFFQQLAGCGAVPACSYSHTFSHQYLILLQ